ncbi:hypothetical protein ACVII0_006399 [Sinorhizobium meliloti]
MRIRTATLEMHDPGEEHRRREGRHLVLREIADDGGQHVALLQRQGRLADQLQRHEDEADAEQHAAEFAGLVASALQVKQPAGRKQERRQPAQVERKNTNHQRRAEIRSQQDGKAGVQGKIAARRKTGGEHCHGGRALQQDCKDRAARGGVNASLPSPCKHTLQRRAIGVLDAAADEMHRVEQQYGRAGEMQREGNESHFQSLRKPIRRPSLFPLHKSNRSFLSFD